jgi:PPM family protein phosphatase
MESNKFVGFRQIRGDRNYQEDSCSFEKIVKDGEKVFLAVLADGMGGHRGGAHASDVAVKTFFDVFKSTSGSVSHRLEVSLNHSNRQIGIEVEVNPDLSGMGCTLVAVAISHDGLEWISVGDSILHLSKDGQLKRMNVDHSMRPQIELQIARGEITPEEGARHPHRNALRSALTGKPMELIDRSPKAYPLHKNDQILISSDGLLSLSEIEVEEILNGRPRIEVSEIAQILVEEVRRKNISDQDNTSVIVVVPYQGFDSFLNQIPMLWKLVAGLAVSFLLGLSGFLYFSEYIITPPKNQETNITQRTNPPNKFVRGKEQPKTDIDSKRNAHPRDTKTDGDDKELKENINEELLAKKSEVDQLKKDNDRLKIDYGILEAEFEEMQGNVSNGEIDNDELKSKLNAAKDKNLSLSDELKKEREKNKDIKTEMITNQDKYRETEKAAKKLITKLEESTSIDDSDGTPRKIADYPDKEIKSLKATLKNDNNKKIKSKNKVVPRKTENPKPEQPTDEVID